MLKKQPKVFLQLLGWSTKDPKNVSKASPKYLFIKKNTIQELNIDFIAVDINNIESVDVQNIRKNNLPTFTWTINNDEKLKLSQKFADNCIFENLLI